MAAKQGRNAYRQELIKEFNSLFPISLFRGIPQHGSTEWTPRKVLWVSMIMFWLPGKSLDEQFSAARHLVKNIHPGWRIPVSYGGFVEAQKRCWKLVSPLLMTQLRPNKSSAGEVWRIAGWLVLAVDGTRFEASRTADNQEELGCAGRDKTSPQIFKTLLQHVGTGLPWDYRIGPGTDSERTHLEKMLAALPEKTLLIADAGFISYYLCSKLIDEKHFFVLRVGGNKTFIENLEEGVEVDENIVYFWPQNSQSKPPLKLRRICFRSSGSGLPVVLITNILDPEILSDEEAQEIYKSRWGIEVYFRHLKQTMDFTKLKSRTAENCLNEQHWRFLSFWILQRIGVNHQVVAGENPRRFSAARARREIREVLQLMQQSRSGKSIKQRSLKMQVDSYVRNSSKTRQNWPRKKNDEPPQPPNIRPAKTTEIQKAKQLEIKFLQLY